MMDAHSKNIVIISGLSGSGKSLALQSLEDIGYYCIDNLPVVLLAEFTQYLPKQAEQEREFSFPGAAISIDSRNQHFLAGLDAELKVLLATGAQCRILFLDTEDAQLIRRYSETRRKHPLTNENTSLSEGISLERQRLQPLKDRAEKVIDTTEMTPHELRGLVRDFAGVGLSEGPLLLIESFGFKHGSPREADFVFDVRCLPNPHWQPDLRPFTGLDPVIIDFFKTYSMVSDMRDEIFNFLIRWLPGFVGENRSYITVAIGCTGGHHRSVFICERLKELFSEQGVDAQVRHRELSKR